MKCLVLSFFIVMSSVTSSVYNLCCPPVDSLSTCGLFCVSGVCSVVFDCFWLSVPVQLIAWKDSSLKWPVMCWVECLTLQTHRLTQSLICVLNWPRQIAGSYSASNWLLTQLLAVFVSCHCVTCSGENWLDARQSGTTNMHVLKPMAISVDILQCMIPSTDLPKYVLNICQCLLYGTTYLPMPTSLSYHPCPWNTRQWICVEIVGGHSSVKMSEITKDVTRVARQQWTINCCFTMNIWRSFCTVKAVIHHLCWIISYAF